MFWLHIKRFINALIRKRYEWYIGGWKRRREAVEYFRNLHLQRGGR